MAQLDQRINISCLDSSENMLDILRNSVRRLGIKNIKIIHEEFESYHTSEKYNVVFMSALIHLLEDKLAAFHQVGSLQKAGDYFVLRTAFKDQIERVDVYKWIPEALEIYQASHPTQEEIRYIANGSGYTIKTTKEYEDVKHFTRKNFLDLYYEKKHSAFWKIPNHIYQKRLSEIERKTQKLNIITCYSYTSLVTMQKTSV